MHLQTFRQVVDTVCSVCFDELPVCVRGRMRVGACGYVCACDAGPATTETAARLVNMLCELGSGSHFA